MALIRNGYAGSTRRELLGVLLSALVALALFDPGSATAHRRARFHLPRDEAVNPGCLLARRTPESGPPTLAETAPLSLAKPASGRPRRTELALSRQFVALRRDSR